MPSLAGLPGSPAAGQRPVPVSDHMMEEPYALQRITSSDLSLRQPQRLLSLLRQPQKGLSVMQGGGNHARLPRWFFLAQHLYRCLPRPHFPAGSSRLVTCSVMRSFSVMRSGRAPRTWRPAMRSVGEHPSACRGSSAARDRLASPAGQRGSRAGKWQAPCAVAARHLSLRVMQPARSRWRSFQATVPRLGSDGRDHLIAVAAPVWRQGLASIGCREIACNVRNFVEVS
jgi:hypothetical protein